MTAPFTAGEIVTADELNALFPLVVDKAADETVNNSAALQNDNDLLFAVAANTTYLLDGMIFYTSGVTPDLKVSFTWPASTTGHWGLAGYDTTGGNTVRFVSVIGGASDTALVVSGATDAHIIINGRFAVAGTAGTLQFRWAQNTATATDTVVHAGSWLRLVRVP